jgi:hypothetical protein
MSRRDTARTRRPLAGALAAFAATLCLLATSAQAQGTGINLAATAFDVVRLAPGVPVASAGIVVSDASEVVFDAVAATAGVGVVVVTPGGTRLTEAALATVGASLQRVQGTPGSSLLVNPLATAAHHLTITVPTPAPGTWTLEFSAPAGNAAEIAVAVTTVMTSPTATALVPLPNTVVLGQAMSLTMAAFSGAQPVVGASIDLDVLAPGGTIVPVTLRDDGTAPDAAAGDGLYAGALIPAAAGTYQARAVLTGTTPGGVAVVRHSAAIFTVVPPSLALVGSATASPVDADANARIDALDVTVAVNVVVPGDYVVRVGLVASNGASTTETRQVTLGSVGATTVVVRFTAEAIRRLGVDGPYRIAPVEITFLGTSGAIPADRATDLGATPALALATLEQPGISSAGTITATPADTNGNGLFDVLDVGVGVTFTNAGTYAWSALLLDRNGRQIGVASASGSQSAGPSTLPLQFNGQTIGANGVDGPFTIGNLLVTGGNGQSLVLLTVGQTSGLLANQFEGFVAPATVPTFFAEGATSTFFDTQFALLNVTGRDASARLTFQLSDGTTLSRDVALGPVARVTFRPKDIPELAEAEFSTTIESTQPIIADRTMRWDATGYGSHAGTGIAAAALEWYLAEGATIGGFDLFYLIQNPGATAAEVEVTYLFPAPKAPLVRQYTVNPRSRFTIWVDQEDPSLAEAEVSAIIRVTNGAPVIVERSMYLTRPGRVFDAGHESPGVTAPALEWFLAEGATGAYFDLFVLVANPDTSAAEVTVDYLLPSGSVLTRDYVVGPQSRFNIWVDVEDPALADTAVATRVRSTNGVPVIVERAMWWPGDARTWHEGHNSTGATQAGTRWALADGEAGGSQATETYVLIANTSTFAGTASVTLVFEDGGTSSRDVPLPASSRTSIPVGLVFPEADGRRFGVVVDSVGAPAAAIVVERAMYSDAPGARWAAGSSVVGTRLQ